MVLSLPWRSKPQEQKLHDSAGSATNMQTRTLTTSNSTTSTPYSLSEPLLAATMFACGATAVLSTRYVYTRFLKRLPTSDNVTSTDISKKRWLKGVVTSVGDGDNFRFYHTPGPGWRSPLKFRTIPTGSKALKNQTIHIRLAGVDAPEAAHFGRPAQPYSDAALAWLKNHIEGRTVYCLLLRRDQYNRIVSSVVVPTFLGFGKSWKSRDVSLRLVKAGFAVVYKSANAEYGQWSRDIYEQLEVQARAAKQGMWASKLKLEGPAEYKRRYAGAFSDPIKAQERVKKARPCI